MSPRMASTRMTHRWNLTVEGEGGAGDGGGGAGGGGGGAEGGAGGAGAGAGAGAGGAEGAGGGAEKPFYEHFASEALKTNPRIQGYKTVEAMAEGLLNLEKRMGIAPERRLDLPEKLDDPKAMAAVWERLGAPAEAAGYGLKLADDAPEADKGLLDGFLKVATEAKMPKVHAEAALKFFAEQSAAAVKAAGEAKAAARAEGLAAIKKDWGAAFDTRSLQVGKFLRQHFGDEFAKTLDADGMGDFPAFTLGIGKIIDAMGETEGGGLEVGGRPAGGVPTPTQAKAQLAILTAHPAYRDARHPEHKRVVAEVTAMNKYANAA